ncbi:GIY-YIG nuclease family protein [Aestuariibaculum sediminum]|uniref:GIY-YIG nuclease family protein n=1 Tax=Aestuariibaculum sediminum TaxID=2770637 RepID=UPI001CB747E8|nr:GIY-YIG nuclease family protein [Aestuariibaculum sediminum]
MNKGNFKYYCYILSNKNRTVLYIGYTENLKNRINQHLNGNGALFKKKYNVTGLVYFEEFSEKKVKQNKEKNN